MDTILVIATCLVLTFWPAIATQCWAAWSIATKHYGHSTRTPDWLYVAVVVGIVISMLLMVPLGIAALDPQRSYLPAILYGFAVMVDFGFIANAIGRVTRARDRYRSAYDSLSA